MDDELHSPKSPPVEDEFQSTLRSAPSFEIYNTSNGEFGDDEKYPGVVLRRRESFGSGEFSFGGRKRMDLIEEGENEIDGPNGIQNLRVEEEEEEEDVVDLEPPSPPMYLAAGLGVDATGFDAAGVGYDNSASDDIFTPNLQESEDPEKYYKRMVDEYPCHPLILKKYAQLLQSKGGLVEAEEYFHRATLADPNDVAILMEYAKLLWEHHHDKDRALIYFERAAQAAPADSDVLAAYTSFLWETEDIDNDVGKNETQNDKENQKTEPVDPSNEESDPVGLFAHLSTGQEIDAANLTTANWSEDSNAADYLKKMVDENPNNPLFLKKYAQFLFQSKDLEAAEDYYSRAVVADPSDGEIMSEYAKLVWELHHDREKASNLFEQAVQATPGESNVLAAYALFLWETEDGEN